MSARAIAVVTLLLAAPVAAQAFNYVEVTDGDIASEDENAPTALGSLDAGVNVVSGTVTPSTDWGDIFSIQVPLGLAITSIEVQVSEHPGGYDAVTKVFETPVYSGLESHLFPIDGSYSYGMIVPLAAPGPYGFTAATQGDVSGPYAWQWTITAPEPPAGVLSLTAAGLLVLVACSHRGRARGLRD